MNEDLVSRIALDGATAVVTGGSRGIGRAVSLRLAEAGAYVVVNYRTGAEAADSVLRTIESRGGAGMAAQFDVADPDAVKDGIADVLKTRERIDILVNNAGISRDGLLGRMKDSDWNQVIDTNLSGAFNMCRAVGRSMIRKRGGRIVNMCSTSGESGNAGQVNYSAAKAGLIGLTKALARELAPRNILVNAVSPGIISGGMSEELNEDQIEAIVSHVPMRRLGADNEVADAVLFLCTRMSDYVTGQVIRVNGGLYM